MYLNRSDLEVLASRIRRGDVRARSKLRDCLLPALVLITRRTLLTGKVQTALARKILTTFRESSAEWAMTFYGGVHALQSEMPRHVIVQVAAAVCDHFIEGLMQEPCGEEMCRSHRSSMTAPASTHRSVLDANETVVG